MALLCSIYDVDSRNLVQEHELTVREDVSEKMNFVLAGSQNSVQRNRIDAHAANYVFCLNDMTDMTKV